MWKFKNRTRPQEETPEPTMTILERQSFDVGGDCDCDYNSGGDRDYNDKQRNDYSNNNNIGKIDALLAKELNSLSFQQRESINEEIHGINVDKVKVIEETPQLLKESFVRLQIELNRLQANSFAFHRCQQLYGDDDNIALYHGVLGNTKRKRTYINTDNFHLVFLRCELFDITKAARRLVNYVELLYELFGDIGIQRRIEINDLTEEEIQILKLGHIQILPGRDRAGRKCIVHISRNTTTNEYTVKSRLRILCYMDQKSLTDIKTQRKGFVVITYYHNVNIFGDLSTRSKVMSKYKKAIPFRVGAIHICIPQEFEDNYFTNPSTLSSDDSSDSSVTINSSVRSTATLANVIKSMIALSIGTKARSKLRIHIGSAMECLYDLQSFGIPSNLIPLVTSITSNKKRRRRRKSEGHKNGDLKVNNHIRWLQICQLKERNIKLCGKEWIYYGGDDQQQIIEYPNHSDILSGRGKNVMNHPGNTVLRSIVVSKLSEYINMKSNNEKTKLTLAVVHLLKNNYNARFLKEETTETNSKLGCWIEMSIQESRYKVRLAFRDKIKRQQTQQQNKTLQLMMMTMPTADNDNDNDNTNTCNNNNDANASASNNINNEKKKISNNIQKRQSQLTSLTTPSIMNLPINVPSSSTSLSLLSRTPTLIVERQKNNNNSLRCNQQTKRYLEEDIDSKPSLFLNQTGGGSRCVGDGSSNICNSTRKKRQLQTTSCISYFDCLNEQ